MKLLVLAAVLIISSLILLSCKKDNPVPPEEQPQVSLSLEDVSCTEAWIKLSTSNMALPANVELLKNDSLINTINLVSADTILYTDSLLPNQTYSFHTIIQPYNHTDAVTSASISVTTMDTTPHNFTWQTFTFGDPSAGGSGLEGVAIIDENNIWAVGEIYLLDSVGVPDPHAYNVIHWDGNQWEVKRVYFPTVCGSTSQTSYPAKAIFAFDDGQIWISSSGDKIAILQNGVQINKFCLPWSFSISKIWGASSNDLYIVGSNGNIAHYRNGQWSSIESGTDLNINDIWGSYEQNTNEKVIIAVGGNILESNERIILQITDDDRAIEISNEGTISYPLAAVWFQGKSKLFTAGSGLYTKIYNEDIQQQITVPNYFIYSLRGDELNDIIICGGVGYIGHFNGISWINYLDNALPQIPGNYYSCAIKGNIVCAVAATIDQKAIAVIGTRN